MIEHNNLHGWAVVPELEDRYQAIIDAMVAIGARMEDYGSYDAVRDQCREAAVGLEHQREAGYRVRPSQMLFSHHEERTAAGSRIGWWLTVSDGHRAYWSVYASFKGRFDGIGVASVEKRDYLLSILRIAGT